MSDIRALIEQAEQYNLRNQDDNYIIPRAKEINPYETVTIPEKERRITGINRDELFEFNPNLLPKQFAGGNLTPSNLIKSISDTFYGAASRANPNYNQLNSLIKTISEGAPLTLTDETGAIVIDPRGRATLKTGNVEFNLDVPNKSVGFNFNSRF